MKGKGINPRALGINPRALGLNPRAIRRGELIKVTIEKKPLRGETNKRKGSVRIHISKKEEDE